MATLFDAKNPARFEVPVPPQEFGQDGGKFYHYYDTLADEIDDNMVAGLKEQLDGLLIFAGLFAGVNTAFLALTLPLMSPDPADDANALLRDILYNLASGRNDSLPSTNTLPSETFSPTGKILTVNVLFSVSLTFALISSFLAVLGRQWLVYYRKRTGGGPERQRWEQLKRFLGAQRWRLEGVLDDVLPSLLQIGLIIFCISLTIYLNTLHPVMSNIVGAFMCAGLAILVMTAIFAAWDKFCPFQSPLSHSVSYLIPLAGWILRWLAIFLLYSIVVWLPALVLRIIQVIHDCFVCGPSQVDFMGVVYKVKDLLDEHVLPSINSLPDHLKRKEERDGTLQITAIRRAICTSDDARTQAHAVSNILSITDVDPLFRLATDEEFDTRISKLCTSSYNRTLQLCGRDRTDLAAATSWVYRAAIAHIFLSTITPDQERRNEQLGHLLFNTLDTPSLSPFLMQNAEPNMVIACLGFMALFTDPGRSQTRARRLELRSTIDGLVNPSWRCISMLPHVIMVHWRTPEHSYVLFSRNTTEERRKELLEWPLGRVHGSWVGKASAVHQNLKWLVEQSNHPQCEDRDILKEYLVDIFKLAGKATADSGGDSSIRAGTAAGFLRFSEGMVRGKDSPSGLIDPGRNLRADLTRALQSEYGKLSEKKGKFISKETLDEFIQLFTELTPAPDSHEEETVDVLSHRYSYEATVNGRPMNTLSWDDEELVHLFSPILQQLNGMMIKNARESWDDLNDLRDYLEFRRQVEELKSIFAHFKAVVNAREMKRRNRDPELRWCYYYE